jgi:hypothetical protein
MRRPSDIKCPGITAAPAKDIVGIFGGSSGSGGKLVKCDHPEGTTSYTATKGAAFLLAVESLPLYSV